AVGLGAVFLGHHHHHH
nr:Chain E, Envelope glycoprotein gp160 [Human immunodeficiency virus 1]6ME1_F Chain F, Envelope glycoprotein gp160 [Human immunodeficiency virus 1]